MTECIHCKKCKGLVIVGWNTYRDKDGTLWRKETHYCTKCGLVNRIRNKLPVRANMPKW